MVPSDAFSNNFLEVENAEKNEIKDTKLCFLTKASLYICSVIWEAVPLMVPSDTI